MRLRESTKIWMIVPSAKPASDKSRPDTRKTYYVAARDVGCALMVMHDDYNLTEITSITEVDTLNSLDEHCITAVVETPSGKDVSVPLATAVEEQSCEPQACPPCGPH